MKHHFSNVAEYDHKVSFINDVMEYDNELFSISNTIESSHETPCISNMVKSSHEAAIYLLTVWVTPHIRVTPNNPAKPLNFDGNQNPY